MSAKLHIISSVAFLAGFLLLVSAGILAFTGNGVVDELQLAGRRLQTVVVAPVQHPHRHYGSSGEGYSSYSSSAQGGSSMSFDNSLFGGNHVFTLAPWGAAGLDFVAYIVAGLCCATYAWFYKMQVVDHIQPMRRLDGTGEDDFDIGIFECLLDPCMCAQLCCPCMVYVRQAHTNAVTGVCGFWETFLAYFLTGVCCMLGPCCLTVFFRMRLKEHMGIEDHLVNDLILSWCCSPCAVGQQAMAVDKELGYQVELCCELRWTGETDLVWKDGTEDVDRDNPYYAARRAREQQGMY